MGSLEDVFGPVIASYTRAQAIEDGVLVDVSQMAREAGFKVPVAMTRHLWEETVEWDEENGPQDEAGRLWDVLWMTFWAIRTSKLPGPRDRLIATVSRIPNRPHEGDGTPQPEEVSFVVHSGPGDEGEHVITLMFPEDD